MDREAAKHANVILFELLGVIFKEDNPMRVIERTLAECHLKYDRKILGDKYEQFVTGKINEREFWEGLGLKDYSMPRKLVIERLEYSVDDNFVKIVPSFIGKKIAVKGNIPMEWAESLFDSSGLSSMLQMSLFSYDFGTYVETEDVYKLLKDRFGDSVLIIESDVDKYNKNREHSLNSALMLRKAVECNGRVPWLVLTNMEELEKLMID